MTCPSSHYSQESCPPAPSQFYSCLWSHVASCNIMTLWWTSAPAVRRCLDDDTIAFSFRRSELRVQGTASEISAPHATVVVLSPQRALHLLPPLLLPCLRPLRLLRLLPLVAQLLAMQPRRLTDKELSSRSCSSGTSTTSTPSASAWCRS